LDKDSTRGLYIGIDHPGLLIPGIGYILLLSGTDLDSARTAHIPMPVEDKKVDTHPALFTLQQPSYPLEESMPNQPE